MFTRLTSADGLSASGFPTTSKLARGNGWEQKAMEKTEPEVRSVKRRGGPGGMARYADPLAERSVRRRNALG